MRVYERVASSDAPQQAVVAQQCSLIASMIEFNSAVLELRVGNFPSALNGFGNAQAVFEEILADSYREERRRGGPLEPHLQDLQRKLTDQLAYSQAMHALAEFFRQMQSGNNNAAVDYGRDAVQLPGGPGSSPPGRRPTPAPPRRSPRRFPARRGVGQRPGRSRPPPPGGFGIRRPVVV